MSLPTDLKTQTNEQISSLIKQMVDYYNSNNNSFSGTTGQTYATYIPNMVAQLQQLVGVNPSTNLQEMIEQDTKLDLEILQAKEDLKVAESRAMSLRNTDKQSYYESWFPLNRPLRTSSNLIILSLGIFFFVLSILILLTMMGINIDISTTWMSEYGQDSELMKKLRILFPFGYGTIFIFLGLILLSVVAFLRKA